MKIGFLPAIILICMAFVSGCQSSSVQAPMNQSITLPHDIPDFVDKKDFENINWGQEAAEFNTGTRADMVGNQKKTSVIGSFLANGPQKWLWHFWGAEDGELTVVGLPENSFEVQPIFQNDAWTMGSIGGSVNGADASLPSTVEFQQAGTWALLVYLDAELFDTIVVDVKKK